MKLTKTITLLATLTLLTACTSSPNEPTNNTPLTENISQEMLLSWETNGNFQTNNNSPELGEWNLDPNTGIYTTENPDYNTCSYNFNKVDSIPEANTNDNDLTETFVNGITKETPALPPTTVNIPLNPSLANSEDYHIEFKEQRFEDSTGNHIVSYSRHVANTGQIIFGTIRCETEEALNQLVGETGNNEIFQNLGVWLTTS